MTSFIGVDVLVDGHHDVAFQTRKLHFNEVGVKLIGDADFEHENTRMIPGIRSKRLARWVVKMRWQVMLLRNVMLRLLLLLRAVLLLQRRLRMMRGMVPILTSVRVCGGSPIVRWYWNGGSGMVVLKPSHLFIIIVINGLLVLSNSFIADIRKRRMSNVIRHKLWHCL